jgi:RHS repeat-associated protein
MGEGRGEGLAAPAQARATALVTEGIGQGIDQGVGRNGERGNQRYGSQPQDTAYSASASLDTHQPATALHSSEYQDSSPASLSLYWYQNDPNGCPIRLLSSTGEVLWAASYTAWADLDLLHAAAVDNPIRLQGQYADPETGLYYNRHRYFCPHAGQFISQDPLGLGAGIPLYQMAPSSLGWLDPLGLKKCNINKATKDALKASKPTHMDRPHMHHIVMEGKFSHWKPENRKLVEDARDILARNGIDLQGSANVVWAENAGHSVEYARKVLNELQSVDGKGAQAVADQLADIGVRLGKGVF